MMVATFFPSILATVAKDRKLREFFGPILSRGHLYEVQESLQSRPTDPMLIDYLFLPSEVTVIETTGHDPDDPEMGVVPLVLVLEKTDDRQWHTYTLVEIDDHLAFGPAFLFEVEDTRYGHTPIRSGLNLWPTSDETPREAYLSMQNTLCSALHQINRPHTRFVRRQWDPDRRKQAKGYRGSYFNGYTEVVIQDRVVPDGPRHATEIHKCLHYVRAHRRVYRSGKTVIIPEHWRGDPKLGVKDHRYRVKPTNSPPPIDPKP